MSHPLTTSESTALPQSAMKTLAAVAALIREADIRTRARADATFANFNVFTVLLPQNDEVRLHTRFIHCLLDPNGSHGCGSLFLDLFFQTLEESPGKDDSNNELRLNVPTSPFTWVVQKEQARPSYGRMDLLLECAGYGIAIENKLNAAEQEGQLAAYANYLQKYYQNSAVLYLTKDGKRSDMHNPMPYIRISYCDHILKWLEKCLRDTYHAQPVNQVLQQYRAVVREITGRTLDAIAMKPITDFILQNPEILRYSVQIEQALSDARTRLLNELADLLTSDLKRAGFGMKREGEFRPKNYNNLVVSPPTNSVLNQAPFQIRVQFDPNANVMAIGPIATSEAMTKHPALFRSMDIAVERLSAEHGLHRGKPLTEWFAGWHNLMKGIGNAALLDTLQTPDGVRKLAESIAKYIEILENAYREASSNLTS
jgi:hypothetical protein